MPLLSALLAAHPHLSDGSIAESVGVEKQEWDRHMRGDVPIPVTTAVAVAIRSGLPWRKLLADAIQGASD